MKGFSEDTVETAAPGWFAELGYSPASTQVLSLTLPLIPLVALVADPITNQLWQRNRCNTATSHTPPLVGATVLPIIMPILSERVL